MEQIRVVELFAGVGGFRLGLEQASSCFQTVWANQWEPSMRSQFAFECYERHFGHRTEHVCQDIVAAKGNIPPHDLLVGGFPCQDYSIAKKGARGIEGKKGVLWWEINAILRAHKPRYVLLENVDRLIKSPAWQKGRDFSIILRCFYEAGYAVEWRVINAADYGEAQRRRRTFLFAFRNDTALFRKAAELICVEGLKGAHQLLLQDGFFAPIFPLYGFERKYSEGWLDEFRYLDLKDLSAAQSCHFYVSGLMVNGRFYSVESIPLQFPYKPLRVGDHPTCRAIFPLCCRHRPLAVSQGRKAGDPPPQERFYLFLFGRFHGVPRSFRPSCPHDAHQRRLRFPQHPCSRRPTDPTSAYANAHRMRTAQRLP